MTDHALSLDRHSGYAQKKDFSDVRRLRDLQDAFHEAGMSPSDKSKCVKNRF